MFRRLLDITRFCAKRLDEIPRAPIGILPIIPVLSLAIVNPMTTLALAQCPEAPPLVNADSTGMVPIPAFVPGEEAGVIFSPPASDFPLEILRVGILWKSLFGGAPQSIEQAIHIYPAGLPNPGTAVFTSTGPTLTDGIVNTFNFEPLPGQIIMNQGPFTVTIEFQNQNAGNQLAPSVAHDGNGCRVGRNVAFASNQWADACLLGVTGDWVFEVVYRPCIGPVQVEASTWGQCKALYR